MQALAALGGSRPAAARPGAALPAGGEPRRGRAVRRHGPDGRHLRRGRPLDGAAVPARGIQGHGSRARVACRLGHRLRHSPCGDGRGLRVRARRGVHGVPRARGPGWAAASVRAIARGHVRVDDERWHGYLANVTPAEFDERADQIPERMRGAEFLTRYGGTTDVVTRVDPAKTYAVRVPARHPVDEHQRVVRWQQRLQALRPGAMRATRTHWSRARRADVRVACQLLGLRPGIGWHRSILWRSPATRDRRAASSVRKSRAAAAAARSRCSRAPTPDRRGGDRRRLRGRIRPCHVRFRDHRRAPRRSGRGDYYWAVGGRS